MISNKILSMLYANNAADLGVEFDTDPEKTSLFSGTSACCAGLNLKLFFFHSLVSAFRFCFLCGRYSIAEIIMFHYTKYVMLIINVIYIVLFSMIS